MWDYKVYVKRDMFYIGIKVGSRVYKTHGVNANGNFGCLPYMNAPEKGVYRRGARFQRLDLLVDDYISGRITFAELRDRVGEKELVNVPNASMHALITDVEGITLVLEPGLGVLEPEGSFAVISNFPLMETPADLSPEWYGKERYDRAVEILRGTDDGFTAADGLELLRETRQGGEWATRVSFVYSRNENAVYYADERDFSDVKKHVFG